MSQFEYLSVLISIVIGLAITQLLSGAARLIQIRHRVRTHATTLCWMVTLFLIDTQIWWSTFDARNKPDWNFFLFLFYLLMPILAYVMSYLILPELGDEDEIDLSANFSRNRPWFFALLALLPTVSLIEQFIRIGAVPADLNTAFLVFFIVLSLIAGRITSEKGQRRLALSALLMVTSFIAILFLHLR